MKHKVNKLFLIIFSILIFSINLLAFENNKDPLEVRENRGEYLLYSNKKLANGIVEKTIYSKEEGKIKTSSVDYKDGIPAGKFELFDTKTGILIMRSNSVYNDGFFEGRLTTFLDGKKYQVYKGKFKIKAEDIINYEDYRENPEIFDLLEAEVETYHSNGKLSKLDKYENDSRILFVYDENAKLESEITFEKDGEEKLIEKIYSEEGLLLFYKNYKTEEEKSMAYYSNKKLRFSVESKIKDSIRVLETNGYLEDGTQNLYDAKLSNGMSQEIKYFPNGNIESEIYYTGTEKDKPYPNSIWTYYLDNGKIKTKISHLDTKADKKKIEEFDKDGKVKSSIIKIKGVTQKKSK